jgi:hypothetical protein
VAEPDEPDLTERLVAPAELAQIIDVDEADVLASIERGELEVQHGDDGEPLVSVHERHQVDGPLESGLTVFESAGISQLSDGAAAERRARERDEQIATAAATGVDVEALTAALARRLAAVAPAEVRIATSEPGMVDVLDLRGGGAGIDIAFAASMRDGSTPADRVVASGSRLLEAAQDEITDVTTDPWPRRGSGTLPEPHAELSEDRATVRLFYGASADPVLELAALPIADVLIS